MTYANDDIAAALGISEQTLKKIRSLLVNDFQLLKRAQKMKDREFEIVKKAVLYVQNNPGTSYKAGIAKALKTPSSLELKLSSAEIEQQKNFETMGARYGQLWENYILMTTSLADLAREKNLDHLANLLNAVLDVTATELGKTLRGDNIEQQDKQMKDGRDEDGRKDEGK